MNRTMKMGGARVIAGLLGIAAASHATGCGDDGEGTGGAGGAGGAGGDASTTIQASSGSPASSGAESTASTSAVGPGGGDGGAGDGGAGGSGEGGSGGAGTGGAGGGEPGACFAAEDFADLFALETDALCVVARYDAPGFFVSSYGMQPTWGAHGGPLTGDYLTEIEDGPITSVELRRWSAPLAANGVLASETTEVDLTDLIGDDADFGGGQIVDLADGVSVFAYTGSDFATEGGLVYFDAEGALEIALLLGGFGLGVDPATGLPLYTSLAPVLDVEIDATGLYGVEGCDEGGFTCGGITYSRWGDSTGPIAVDEDGNVFAVATSFDGTQTARGFAATQMSTGVETEGTDFFTVDGFGSPLAALAPDGATAGLLVYQATNDESFLQEAPVFVPFTTGDDAIGPTAEPATLLTPAIEGSPVSLMADGEGRLWVGVATDEGTTFAVLARP